MSSLIYQKLHAIQSGLGKMPKEGVLAVTSSSSYAYLKVDTILEYIAPLLDEHGVVISPVETIVERDVTRAQDPDVTANPASWSGRVPKMSTSTVLMVRFQFTAIEDGSSLTVQVAGESADVGDKGVNRAMRAAQKNALIQTFSIVTGERDPEEHDADPETQNEPKQNRGQQHVAAARPSTTAPKPATSASSPGDTTPVIVTNSAAPDTDDTPIGDLRAQMRELQGKHGLTLEQINYVGTAVTGEIRAKWFMQPSLMKKVVAAVADDAKREELIEQSATGEVK